jgi:hypothetical protein
VWVEATPDNANRVWDALRKFGAPLKGVVPDDLANPDLVYTMGVEPNRVDIMMGIDGVTFATAWRRRVRVTYGGVPTFVMGSSDFIRAKRSARRPLDLADVRSMLRAAKRRPCRAKRRRRRA